ncbi:MAG: hypothetical protein QMD04_08465 [Anaerolineales bacterium]|nr:hypothetical protein [Anaerolineales bacterium]
MSLFGCGIAKHAALRFYQPFDFFQHRLQIRSICGDYVIFPNVFVMRRGGQAREVVGVVVTKDQCFIGALIVIGVGVTIGRGNNRQSFDARRFDDCEFFIQKAQSLDFAPPFDKVKRFFQVARLEAALELASTHTEFFLELSQPFLRPQDGILYQMDFSFQCGEEDRFEFVDV